MTLDEITAQWERDCEIDEIDPGHSSAITPKIHSKYLNEVMAYKVKLLHARNSLRELEALKVRYYRGEMTSAELAERNWIQWQYKTLKSDVRETVANDAEVRTLSTRVEYLEIAIAFLESIMQEIRSRSFHCRNVIEFQKFRAGA